MMRISQEKRSHIMRSIHSKNTKPEIIVDGILSNLDINYMVHCHSLYGKPDFLCEVYKAAIFVNGCFWHGHQCHMFRTPDSTNKYWVSKLQKNSERDIRVVSILNNLGYKVIVVWECALIGKRKLDTLVLQDCLEEWLLAGNGNCEIDSKGLKAMVSSI
ncbi:very short patch repair endonuclease [Klebsiella pneumoniae]|uniref:very short patch repair endonuclease n=1 Tax=Klebsiella pneumoniae TaxID=573 RepID=UPI001D0E70B4|nr:very short patch repair endonuclease [Klebsiella pneumoniae]MEB2884152.1 very short patch repair endonuclease [Klebsiella pneumoniae]